MASDCNYCAHRLYAEDRKMLTECTLSHGKPCLACERQVKLRERIEETKKLLDALVLEEREAWTDINRHHDPFQTHRVPLEIASHIFRFILPPFTLQEPEEFRSGVPSGKIYRGLDSLRLGAVCRAWRQSVWSMPHMWSDIMLDLHCQPTRNMVNVIEEWLERSNPLPLNIRLFFVEVPGSKQCCSHESNRRLCFTTLTALFDEHSARWKTWSAQFPGWISHFVHGDSQRGAPLLTTLQLLDFDNHEIPGQFLLQDVERPQPTRVDLAGHSDLTSVAISWINVTHARLEGFDLAFYVNLLQNAPRLVKLRLDPARFDCEPPIITTPPIQHNLQILYIYYDDYIHTDDGAMNFYSVIFDSVCLPLLKDLTISGQWQSGPWDKLKQFLERSAPPLTHLDITSNWDHEEALDLLYRLPSLQVVALNLPKINRNSFFGLETLFNHLICDPIITNESPPRPQLLPNLLGFEYVFHSYPGPIPWVRHLPHLRRPLSGKPERSLQYICLQEARNGEIQTAPILHKDQKNLDENAIRGLIGLMDDDVELWLPNVISRDDLLSLLV